MNKYICALAIALLSLVGMAAQTDVKGDFYTIGPDKYADGTVVPDGGLYVLVLQKKGTQFEGFRPDGTFVNSNNSVRLNKSDWKAKDGTLNGWEGMGITLKADQLKTGNLALYLVDTREYVNQVYATDGSLCSVTTNLSASVQGYAEIAAYAYVSETYLDVEGTTENKAYLLSTIDNTKIIEPVIKDMKVDGDYIVLSVGSTSPLVTYNAVSGESLSDTSLSASGAKAVAPVTGSAAGEDGIIKIRVRRNDSATREFFKIVRNPLK